MRLPRAANAGRYVATENDSVPARAEFITASWWAWYGSITISFG